jgi:hypothetical protein
MTIGLWAGTVAQHRPLERHDPHVPALSIPACRAPRRPRRRRPRRFVPRDQGIVGGPCAGRVVPRLRRPHASRRRRPLGGGPVPPVPHPRARADPLGHADRGLRRARLDGRPPDARHRSGAAQERRRGRDLDPAAEPPRASDLVGRGPQPARGPRHRARAVLLHLLQGRRLRGLRHRQRPGGPEHHPARPRRLRGRGAHLDDPPHHPGGQGPRLGRDVRLLGRRHPAAPRTARRAAAAAVRGAHRRRELHRHRLLRRSRRDLAARRAGRSGRGREQGLRALRRLGAAEHPRPRAPLAGGLRGRRRHLHRPGGDRRADRPRLQRRRAPAVPRRRPRLRALSRPGAGQRRGPLDPSEPHRPRLLRRRRDLARLDGARRGGGRLRDDGAARRRAPRAAVRAGGVQHDLGAPSRRRRARPLTARRLPRGGRARHGRGDHRGHPRAAQHRHRARDGGADPDRGRGRDHGDRRLRPHRPARGAPRCRSRCPRASPEPGP